MKKTIPLLFLILITDAAFSQTAHPWERPLRICTSTNGINFSSCTLFQDSSGVPSLAMDSAGRLLSAFQWFPEPFQGLHWDSVAVKISLDSALTWSEPQPIVVQNLPINFQRPFDPTLVALPGGEIRIYFSSGPPGANTIATYSAIGTDGIHYTFEPGIRFSQAGRNCIDPAVNLFQGLYHYTSPKGAPQDGAFHATSTDGLNFTQVADISSDSQHNWTGNMITDSLVLKFYGTGGPYMWFATTGNGIQWSPYQNLNISGGDPAVLKIPGRNYIIVYTGPPSTTAVSEITSTDPFTLYPNPSNGTIHISDFNSSEELTYSILDLSGRILQRGNLQNPPDAISVQSFSPGLYLFKIEGSEIFSQKKFQIIIQPD